MLALLSPVIGAGCQRERSRRHVMLEACALLRDFQPLLLYIKTFGTLPVLEDGFAFLELLLSTSLYHAACFQARIHAQYVISMRTDRSKRFFCDYIIGSPTMYLVVGGVQHYCTSIAKRIQYLSKTFDNLPMVYSSYCNKVLLAQAMLAGIVPDTEEHSGTSMNSEPALKQTFSNVCLLDNSKVMENSAWTTTFTINLQDEPCVDESRFKVCRPILSNLGASIVFFSHPQSIFSTKRISNGRLKRLHPECFLKLEEIQQHFKSKLEAMDQFRNDIKKYRAELQTVQRHGNKLSEIEQLAIHRKIVQLLMKIDTYSNGFLCEFLERLTLFAKGSFLDSVYQLLPRKHSESYPVPTYGIASFKYGHRLGVLVHLSGSKKTVDFRRLYNIERVLQEPSYCYYSSVRLFIECCCYCGLFNTALRFGKILFDQVGDLLDNNVRSLLLHSQISLGIDLSGALQGYLPILRRSQTPNAIYGIYALLREKHQLFEGELLLYDDRTPPEYVSDLRVAFRKIGLFISFREITNGCSHNFSADLLRQMFETVSEWLLRRISMSCCSTSQLDDLTEYVSLLLVLPEILERGPTADWKDSCVSSVFDELYFLIDGIYETFTSNVAFAWHSLPWFSLGVFLHGLSTYLKSSYYAAEANTVMQYYVDPKCTKLFKSMVRLLTK